MVHVTEVGHGDHLVLFVHGGVQGGIGGGPKNFAGQMPLADLGWKLRLLDRPGFGYSPSRGPDDMAADAVLIADELGAGSHLVGHSFGGAGALLAAARRPAAVRSLILIEPALQPMLAIDPVALVDPASQAATAIIMRHLMSAATPEEFALGFLGGLGSGGSGGDNKVAAEAVVDRDKARELGCSLLRARMASPPDMRAAADIVAAAGVPVLIVSGGYSPGQEATGRHVARLTGGRHVIVAAPSHFIQEDSPAALNETLDAFMRSADRADKQPSSG